MLRQRSLKQAFKIVSVVVLENRDEGAMLARAASLAGAVDEALGAAILETIPEHRTLLGDVDNVRSVAGKGVAGSVDGHAVVLGNASFFSEIGLSIGNLGQWAERIAQQAETVMFVAVDGELAGFLKLSIDNSK